MLNTGLKYSLQGEAVFISNEEGLRGDVFMRVYDVRDLTLGLTQFPGPRLEIPEPGGEGAELVPEIRDDEAAELDDFMEIIRKSFLKITGKLKVPVWMSGTAAWWSPRPPMSMTKLKNCCVPCATSRPCRST